MTGRRAAAALRGLAAMITLLVLVIGLPAVRPNPHAEMFGRLLRAEAERAKTARST